MFLSAIYNYVHSFKLPERISTTKLLTHDHNRCTVRNDNPPALSEQFVATRRLGLTGMIYDIDNVSIDILKNNAEFRFPHKQGLGWKEMLTEMRDLNEHLIEAHDRTVTSGDFRCGAITDQDYVGKLIPRYTRPVGYEAAPNALPSLNRA